ncbi:interleukin-32 isoform X2 [Camelus bactrianus]|uniref:Interleukin-32 isoform X2 n=1 Tax=Camelus bactrianus TaxID=9837 RepID=A0AC58NXN7_CAMBA
MMVMMKGQVRAHSLHRTKFTPVWQHSAQVQPALEKLEDQINEDMLEAVGATIEDNVSESAPLLSELRLRTQRPADPDVIYDGPEVQEPESIWDRVKRMFDVLMQKWSDALAWLWKKVAACLQSLGNAIEAIWRKFKGFCSSLGQLFKSCITV